MISLAIHFLEGYFLLISLFFFFFFFFFAIWKCIILLLLSLIILLFGQMLRIYKFYAILEYVRVMNFEELSQFLRDDFRPSLLIGQKRNDP